MWHESGNRKGMLPWALVVLAGVLRLAVAEAMLGRISFPDTQLYEGYARRLLTAREYAVGDDRAQRAPGYPVFLAACWKLAGVSEADFADGADRRRIERPVLWGQVLLSTLTCGLVFLLGRRLEATGWPNGTALVALLLSVVDPYAVALAALELSETVFAFGLMLTAWLAVSATHFGRWLVVGAAAGATVLVRPSGLLLPPLALAVAAWFPSTRTRPVTWVAAAAGFLLILAPWWIRNAAVYGRFVPTTLNVGESLYDGVRPGATGASDMAFTHAANVRKLSEVERDRHWWREARRAVFDDPQRILALAVTKIARFWSPWPNEVRFRSSAILLATSTTTFATLALALVGAWRLRRHAGSVLLLVLPAAYFCLLHAVFVSSVRYRVPVMPFLDLVAGAGAAAIGRSFAAKEQP